MFRTFHSKLTKEPLGSVRTPHPLGIGESQLTVGIRGLKFFFIALMSGMSSYKVIFGMHGEIYRLNDADRPTSRRGLRIGT